MPRSRLPIRLSAAAALALTVGLAATAVLFAGIRRLEYDKVELDFQQRARARILTVRQQLDETVQVLKVLNQLFVTFEPVSREQFRVFTQPLLARHPYLQAFNFHRIIPGDQRAAYEEQMRTLHPGFSMTQLVGGKPVTAP